MHLLIDRYIWVSSIPQFYPSTHDLAFYTSKACSVIWWVPWLPFLSKPFSLFSEPVGNTSPLKRLTCCSETCRKHRLSLPLIPLYMWLFHREVVTVTNQKHLLTPETQMAFHPDLDRWVKVVRSPTLGWKKPMVKEPNTSHKGSSEHRESLEDTHISWKDYLKGFIFLCPCFFFW